MGTLRTQLMAWAACAALASFVGPAPPAFAQAQEIAPTGEYTEGVPVGAWKLYPKAFVGAIWNDNINQSPSSAPPAFGNNTAFDNQNSSNTAVRLVPHLVGVYDGGIHKSTVYGVADAQLFNGNTVAATAGFTHLYEAMKDLLFTFQGNYTRQTDLFNNALNFNNGAIGPNLSTDANIPIILNPFGTTPSVNPAAYNQFTAATSVTKNFDNTFVVLSGTVFHIAFDDTPNLSQVNNPLQTSHDGTSYWVTGRVGANIVPSLYVFAEGSGIFQRFNNSLFDTNGYRAIGGFGSIDPNSLFRGEVYGGYQAQHLVHDELNGFGIPSTLNGIPITGTGIPSDTNSVIYGGRLYYYPTRYWTLVAALDQTLGISTIISPTIPAGTPVLATNAILQTNYALSRSWTIGARGGYTRSQFYGIPRLDNGWLAGASFNYEIWRNLVLTLDYQYNTVHSDAAFSDFTRNIYTAGLTYKY
jgi:hypothetical protein